MKTLSLSWLDRLLIKIALLKAAARGHMDPMTARHLQEAFRTIREE